jgi:hypothetical protein
MKHSILILFILLLGCQNPKNSQGEDFSKNVNKVAVNIIDESDQLTFFEKERTPIKAKFQQFSSGSVRPKGWILDLTRLIIN